MPSPRPRRNRLESFLASPRGKRILNRFYSWAAAFVILGALFKLLHIRYGDELLIASMLTEFIVFFISGFERPDPTYQWEKAFPELEEGEATKRTESRPVDSEKHTSDSQPKTETELGEQISSLQSAITELSDATSQLAQISQQAPLSVPSIPSSQATDPSSLQHQTTQYIDEMESLARNVTGLNAIYELHLKSISGQMASIEKINKGLQEMSQMYAESLHGSNEFREQNQRLVHQLAELNSIYARMIQTLSAGAGLAGAVPTDAPEASTTI